MDKTTTSIGKSSKYQISDMLWCHHNFEMTFCCKFVLSVCSVFRHPWFIPLKTDQTFFLPYITIRLQWDGLMHWNWLHGIWNLVDQCCIYKSSPVILILGCIYLISHNKTSSLRFILIVLPSVKCIGDLLNTSLFKADRGLTYITDLQSYICSIFFVHLDQPPNFKLL